MNKRKKLKAKIILELDEKWDKEIEKSNIPIQKVIDVIQDKIEAIGLGYILYIKVK